MSKINEYIYNRTQFLYAYLHSENHDSIIDECLNIIEQCNKKMQIINQQINPHNNQTQTKKLCMVAVRDLPDADILTNFLTQLSRNMTQMFDDSYQRNDYVPELKQRILRVNCAYGQLTAYLAFYNKMGFMTFNVSQCESINKDLYTLIMDISKAWKRLEFLLEDIRRVLKSNKNNK